MRSNVENALLRGTIQETAQLFKSEVLAISGNITLASGMPMVLAFDPGGTNRIVTMYTPAVTLIMHKHEIFNISSGVGVLAINQPDGSTFAGLIAPGQRGEVFWNPKTQLWQVYTQGSGVSPQTGASQVTIQQYTTLALLTNTDVLELALPFAFKLNSVGFRIRRPATTAAKAATLQAQVNGVSCTGGAISLTSANATPTGTLVAGSTITAGGATNTAGQTVGVLVSAVTTFIEGDGYVEYNVTNLSQTS